MARKRLLSLLVGLMTGISPSFAEDRSLQETLEGAQALAIDRDFKGAEVLLMEALEQHPREEDVVGSLAALWLLGLYRGAQEDYDGAAAAYLDRLKLLMKHSEVEHTTWEVRQTLQALAESYDLASRGEEAREIWMRLAERGREDPGSNSLGVAYFGMARSFAREGHYQEARRYFDKTLEVRAGSDDKLTLFNPLMEYAKLLRKLGEIDQAKKLEERAHALMASVVRSTDDSSIQIEGDGELGREWPPPDWGSSE